MGGNPLKYTDPQGLLNPALAVCAAWPVGTGICVATGAVIAWGAWSSNQHPGGGTAACLSKVGLHILLDPTGRQRAGDRLLGSLS